MRDRVECNDRDKDYGSFGGFSPSTPEGVRPDRRPLGGAGMPPVNLQKDGGTDPGGWEVHWSKRKRADFLCHGSGSRGGLARRARPCAACGGVDRRPALRLLEEEFHNVGQSNPQAQSVRQVPTLPQFGECTKMGVQSLTRDGVELSYDMEVVRGDPSFLDDRSVDLTRIGCRGKIYEAYRSTDMWDLLQEGNAELRMQ